MDKYVRRCEEQAPKRTKKLRRSTGQALLNGIEPEVMAQLPLPQAQENFPAADEMEHQLSEPEAPSELDNGFLGDDGSDWVSLNFYSFSNV